MTVVLDTSLALAWFFVEEKTPAVLEVLDDLSQHGAWVPSLWKLEVANALEMAVRRGYRDAAFRDATLSDLALLPIFVDPETEDHAWGTTLRMAVRYRLTLYDAAYLELAQRRSLPLATLDRELRIAARAEKVPLLGL